MLNLAVIEPAVFVITFGSFAFVLLLLGGIFWYSWHEAKRKGRFKMHKEREQTHREIAAYVAEGSISPGEAERLIRAMGETDEKVFGVAARPGLTREDVASRPAPA